MRRLVGHQAVSIELDGDGGHEIEFIDGVVEGVGGLVASVAAQREIGSELRERLRSGALGFLMFEYQGAPIALRGAARAISDGVMLEFVVLDGVQVAERRAAARVALSIPVRVVLVADDAPAVLIETSTVDLSVGGALLKRRPRLGTGPWQLDLFLPAEATPVHCAAVLVRETPGHLGVAFANLSDGDLTRLRELIADPPPVGELRAESVSDASLAAGGAVIVSRDTDGRRAGRLRVR